ncbi:MAG TPA: DUF72 domain-containing protein [Roseiflexaceae bacterium]|nr:DUF72 domain-containing protein [Roseiflexaceae bacterium]
MTNPGRFRLGCAVWAHKDWVGDLFPAGSRSADYLALYSRRLTTVEGNTTFYAVPQPDVVVRWAAQTPADFQFCFKIPQDISHTGSLDAGHAATHAFVERMTPIGERLGPFFLQLPPGFRTRQYAELGRWLAAWPPGHRVAVEVRHLEWYAEAGEQALMTLLDQAGAGRVLMDVRPLDLGLLPGAEADLRRARDNKPDVPLHVLQSGGFAMVRYIGHPDLQRNTALLDEWAAQVSAWLAAGIDVYFFMHCPVERVSPALCRALQQRLSGLAGVPPLPWDQIDLPQQDRLF